MFEIEKNVPVQPKYFGRGISYPLQNMEIGDSFLAPITKLKSLYAWCSNYGKKHGKKFTVRTVSPDEVRVWRIK